MYTGNWHTVQNTPGEAETWSDIEPACFDYYCTSK